jgi:hypothetical protein
MRLKLTIFWLKIKLGWSLFLLVDKTFSLEHPTAPFFMKLYYKLSFFTGFLKAVIKSIFVNKSFYV